MRPFPRGGNLGVGREHQLARPVPSQGDGKTISCKRPVTILNRHKGKLFNLKKCGIIECDVSCGRRANDSTGTPRIFIRNHYNLV